MKNILVIGGAHRLGRAITEALVEDRHRVGFTYFRSTREAETLLRSLRRVNSEVNAFCVDLRSVSSIRSLFRTAARTLAPLDVLVHVAANYIPSDFFEVTEKIVDETFSVNFKACFFTSQCAAKLMEKNPRGGSIIHFSDAILERPRLGYIPYSASKAAIQNLVASLARRLGPKIRVNAIAPGAVLLPMEHSPRERRRAEKRALLKRLGQPEDVVDAVRYLLRDKSFVTGHTLRVDGGASLS